MANDRARTLFARYRPTLLVVVVAIAAFTFSAIDDRNARHRAGITDACAREQAAERIFPMHRCLSEEEVVAELARMGVKPLLPNMDAYLREWSSKNNPRPIDCEKLDADRSSWEGRPGPDYLFALIEKFDCEHQEKQDSGRPKAEKPGR
jgi:hypothetical protein